MFVKRLFLGIWLIAPVVWAGGSPLRTVVVVNKNSDRSLELGRYYAEKRGLPDHHIVTINTMVSSVAELSVYSNQIEGPIKAYIADAGLSNQIDCVVFSMDIPYRVYKNPYADFRHASLTATFFYGFYSSPNAFVSGCDLAVGSQHGYFEQEQSFCHGAPYSSNRYYLTSMLTASNMLVAKRLVDRSVLADHSRPSASVLLMRTSDPFRNVQWEEFERTLYLGRFIDAPQTQQWLEADSVSGRTNIMGVTAGKTSHAWLGANPPLPGAFGEHLTSFGGYLYENPNSQMIILNWITNGYAGSHGTVVEPCAYTNKFASPRIHYWYARGFSLGESLWMSVQNPYQGLFVGDALCEPYARPPVVMWMNITNHTIISGTIGLTGKVESATIQHPVSSASWWSNGRWQSDVPGHVPLPGNEILITINGSNRSYTVDADDTLYDVTKGVAAAINASPFLVVTARAFGDRIEVVQKTIGSAAGWTINASVTAGTADVATVQVFIPSNSFLETSMQARELLTVSGNSASGDVVRAIITRLDGLVVTNSVLVTTPLTSPLSIMTSLSNAINANTNLTTSLGCLAKYLWQFNSSATVTNAQLWLFARTNTWEGSDVEVVYDVITNESSTLNASESFSDNFNDNADNLKARATLFFSVGVTQWMPVVNLNTTNWPDGPHELTLVARDGTGVETEGRARVSVVVDNHDLACAVTSPVDRIYRLKTGVLTVEVTTAASMGSVTQVVIRAEGKDVATGVVAEVVLSDYGAGPLRLQAQAWDDLGHSTLSEIVTVRLFTDTDDDGMSDQWEYVHFGTAVTNVTGLADSDGDGVSNYEEFIADTQPTNAQHYLSISAIDEEVSVEFPSSTDRWYQLRFNDGDLLDSAAWLPTGHVFSGNGTITNVSDVATNSIRFYAIEPRLPQ
jgi:uncharacterized protein (TIGR03790 family)